MVVLQTPPPSISSLISFNYPGQRFQALHSLIVSLQLL